MDRSEIVKINLKMMASMKVKAHLPRLLSSLYMHFHTRTTFDYNFGSFSELVLIHCNFYSITSPQLYDRHVDIFNFMLGPWSKVEQINQSSIFCSSNKISIN